MQILNSEASAVRLLSGSGVRVLLFHGPTDPQAAIQRFCQIRWPAGIQAAVLPVGAAPLLVERFGIDRTPAVGAVLDGRLVALEHDPDPRIAAVRAVARARARAGPAPIRRAS